MALLQHAAFLAPNLSGEPALDPSAYWDTLHVPNVLWIGKGNLEIAGLCNGLNPRSASRAGLLLAAVTRKAEAALASFLGKDPYSVGIFCALEQGPVGYLQARSLAGGREPRSAEFGQAFSPRQYLQHLPISAAAQAGILLGIKGPTNVFSDSEYGCAHAMDAAREDLAGGRISAALVCASYSLEDPVVALRNREHIPPSRTLAEGAGFLLLTNDAPAQNPLLPANGISSLPFFGIADPLLSRLIGSSCP